MGSGSRGDRLRALQLMREYWNQVNHERRTSVRQELEEAQLHQAKVDEFWGAHKRVVVDRWIGRTGGRGKTKVADIPEVSAQWHANNPGRPEEVLATAQKVGSPSPYWWVCPQFPDRHPAWRAWPKDRVQRGAGCPACRKLTSLADLPSLAAQYAGSETPESISYGSHARVAWRCRTWAADPVTGAWERTEHRFMAEIKSRALQQDGCLVCVGYVVDASNSLERWFPELAEQLDDPAVDPATMPTTAHNASRRTRRENEEDGYQMVRWSCRHGHRWKATVLNRVQGTDCPKCSTAGISKEQVRLAAELAFLFELRQPAERDLRLPEDVPDFAPHHLPIPGALKPSHWRYREVEVDVILRLPASGVTVGIEYDGAFHHSPALRRAHRRRDERDKSEVLVKAGLLDLLVHVRLGDLDPLEGEHLLSVSLPERSDPFAQASAVARALYDLYPGSCPDLETYLAAATTRAQHHADAYIMALWGQLKPPRGARPKAGHPKPRPLKATPPTHGSWLTPVGEPYRNPDKLKEIVRDYQCQCGQQVTRVQAQVTSGNTSSCGCRQTQAAHRLRVSIPFEESKAVRTWASRRGHPVGTAGRVPGRYTASYRLARAGHTELLGPGHLLLEEPVRAWAQRQGQLGARSRITGETWLHYADHILSSHKSNSAATPSSGQQTAAEGTS